MIVDEFFSLFQAAEMRRRLKSAVAINGPGARPLAQWQYPVPKEQLKAWPSASVAGSPQDGHLAGGGPVAYRFGHAVLGVYSRILIKCLYN